MLFYFNFALKVHSVFYKPSSIEKYIFVFLQEISHLALKWEK